MCKMHTRTIQDAYTNHTRYIQDCTRYIQDCTRYIQDCTSSTLDVYTRDVHECVHKLQAVLCVLSTCCLHVIHAGHACVAQSITCYQKTYYTHILCNTVTRIPSICIHSAIQTPIYQYIVYGVNATPLTKCCCPINHI